MEEKFLPVSPDNKYRRKYGSIETINHSNPSISLGNNLETLLLTPG
jgi:hypothetical protein